MRIYVLFMALLMCVVPAFADTSRPNIVLILADDQGWNGTSALMHLDREDSRSDYYQTPNIERLARPAFLVMRSNAFIDMEKRP